MEICSFARPPIPRMQHGEAYGDSPHGGRSMAPDDIPRQEEVRRLSVRPFACGPGGLALIAPACGRVGERVVAYVDHVGRLEGLIARIFPRGFAMTIEASRRKRDKLAAQLTWLANRHLLDMPEARRHQRISDLDQMVPLVLPDGAQERCAIIDLSVSGVAVVSLNRPPIGSMVRVGKAPGRVVRHLDNGFTVEFSQVQSPELLMATIAQAWAIACHPPTGQSGAPGRRAPGYGQLQLSLSEPLLCGQRLLRVLRQEPGWVRKPRRVGRDERPWGKSSWTTPDKSLPGGASHRCPSYQFGRTSGHQWAYRRR
jgi:hypothetical protein